MSNVRKRIAAAIPWIEPLLDYFDWRKRLLAIVAGVAMGAWSFVKDLSWPAIATLTFATLILMAYAVVFPAFIKLIHVGVTERPNASIWKHKKNFELYEAACLLANQPPTSAYSKMNGDARAWYGLLGEAITTKEIKYVLVSLDSRRFDENGEYSPYEHTIITREEFKKFCDTRNRSPEFLN